MATLVEKYFSQADIDAVENAVKRSEKRSSGELIVELSSHSKHWRTERLIHALIVTLICMLAGYFFTHESDWGTYYNVTQAILWGVIGFAITYFGWGTYLKRNERRRQIVWNRALKLFSEIVPTRGGTGVLIFLSLEEEQAAIVADKGIASKLPPEYWHTPHGMIIKAMKQGRHAEGIIEAIQTITVELEKHFPYQSDDTNELPDKPKILD